QPDVLLIRASVDLQNPKRATACGWSGRDFFEDERRTEQIPLGSEGQSFLGQGWHAREQTGDGTEFRWTSATEAEVLLPLARAGTLRVYVSALPFRYPRAPDATIDITVNGTRLAPQPMSPAFRTYEWIVPVERMRVGF